MKTIPLPTKLAAERKELMRLAREKAQRAVALPRTFTKPGNYPGLDYSKAIRRDGSLALDQAPSLFANTLIFKDGSTKEYKK